VDTFAYTVKSIVRVNDWVTVGFNVEVDDLGLMLGLVLGLVLGLGLGLMLGLIIVRWIKSN